MLNVIHYTKNCKFYLTEFKIYISQFKDINLNNLLNDFIYKKLNLFRLHILLCKAVIIPRKGEVITSLKYTTFATHMSTSRPKTQYSACGTARYHISQIHTSQIVTIYGSTHKHELLDTPREIVAFSSKAINTLIKIIKKCDLRQLI